MAYPNSFDANTILFTDLKNQVAFTLSAGVDSVVTDIPVTSLMGFTGAQSFYAVLDDGGGSQPEIVKVTSANGTGPTLTVVRGQEGTTAVAHLSGAKIILEPTKQMYFTIRQGLELVQTYSAALVDPAAVTKLGGELMYFNGQLYIGLPGNASKRITYQTHDQLSGVADDDHLQYMTDARALTAHTNDIPGTHLTTVAHDHSTTAAKKFRSGTVANRPTPTQSGEVYFATDTRSLYFSRDPGTGLIWEQYVTMATGTMLFFETSCPSGWTRVTSLDGKFVRGAPAGVWTGLVSGGAATHTHTLPVLIDHTHSVSANSGNTSTEGSHSHSVESSSAGGGSTSPFQTNAGGSSVSTSSGGSHAHGFTIPAQDTDNATHESPVTEAFSNLPPNRTLIICRKG